MMWRAISARRYSVVNLDVTAPGSTLALGLMFLRTNDAGVAAHIRVPNTVGRCRFTQGWPLIDGAWFQRLKLKM